MKSQEVMNDVNHHLEFAYIKSLKYVVFEDFLSTIANIIISNNPQLKKISISNIQKNSIDFDNFEKLTKCEIIEINNVANVNFGRDCIFFRSVSTITVLKITGVKKLNEDFCLLIAHLINLKILEIGSCTTIPTNFGKDTLQSLIKLEKLRMEDCNSLGIVNSVLESISKMPLLSNIELINAKIEKGFDRLLIQCKNIRTLFIIPEYISSPATTNDLILKGIKEIDYSLEKLIWGFIKELLSAQIFFYNNVNI